MELAAVSQQAYPFSVSAAVKWFTRWRNEKTPREHLPHGVLPSSDRVDFCARNIGTYADIGVRDQIVVGVNGGGGGAGRDGGAADG
jgi:hypothetical protein